MMGSHTELHPDQPQSTRERRARSNHLYHNYYFTIILIVQFKNMFNYFTLAKRTISDTSFRNIIKHLFPSGVGVVLKHIMIGDTE